MKTLLLLRHAKSSWSDPTAEDHERTLNGRGRRAAGLLARHLAGRTPRPDLVLCSSATRTVETLKAVMAALTPNPPALVEPGLYLASAERLLQRVQDLEGEGCVLLVGHNPGLHELALYLSGDGRPDTFPTAALAVFAVDGAWRDLGPSRARLADYVTPAGLSPGEADDP